MALAWYKVYFADEVKLVAIAALGVRLFSFERFQLASMDVYKAAGISCTWTGDTAEESSSARKRLVDASCAALVRS